MSRVLLAGIGCLVALGSSSCGGDDGDTPSPAELTSEAEKVLSDCALADEAVGDATGERIDSSTETTSGALPDSNGEFEVEFSGCTYTAAGGGSFDVLEVVDPDGEPDSAGFETLAAEATGEVVGIGDEAVVLDDKIIVRAGDHVYVVSGQDEDFQPLDSSAVEPLATATVAKLGG